MKKVEKLGSTSQYLRGIGRYTSVSSSQCGLHRTLAKVTYSKTLSWEKKRGGGEDKLNCCLISIRTWARSWEPLFFKKAKPGGSHM